MATVADRSAGKRYENLDGLRAFACILILAGHIYELCGYELPVLGRLIAPYGLLVELFMILSGFGICAGYLKRFQERSISAEEFYRRRSAKILPFFAVITLIYVLEDHTLRGAAEGFMELTLLFGFMPNNSNLLQINGVCWTLGTIFAFYIMFPFFTFLLSDRRRALIAFAVMLVTQVLCECIFMTGEFVPENFVNRTSILYCLPYFMSGCVLYLFRKEIGGLLGRVRWIAPVCCLAATTLFYLIPSRVGGYFIQDHKTLVLFSCWCACALGPKQRWMSSGFVRFVSGISMEIYLSHMLVLYVLRIVRIPERLGMGFASYGAMVALLAVGTVAFVTAVNDVLSKTAAIQKAKQ